MEIVIQARNQKATSVNDTPIKNGHDSRIPISRQNLTIGNDGIVKDAMKLLQTSLALMRLENIESSRKSGSLYQRGIYVTTTSIDLTR